MTDPARLITAHAEAQVRFIVVGGMAGIAHGSARVTFRIDCVHDRAPDNVAKLARALGPFRPALRGAPAGLPFRCDEPTITAGLNFTLDTSPSRHMVAEVPLNGPSLTRAAPSPGLR